MKKRKATSSPDNDDYAAIEVRSRRPIKTRIIDSVESNNDKVITIPSDDSVSESEYEAESGRSSSPDSTIEHRITRGSIKQNKEHADFSALAAVRQRKIDKKGGKKSRRNTPNSPDNVEKIINPIVARVQKENEKYKLGYLTDEGSYVESQKT